MISPFNLELNVHRLNYRVVGRYSHYLQDELVMTLPAKQVCHYCRTVNFKQCYGQIQLHKVPSIALDT